MPIVCQAMGCPAPVQAFLHVAVDLRGLVGQEPAATEPVYERSHEAERLINWAFRAFETRRLYTRGEGLVDARSAVESNGWRMKGGNHGGGPCVRWYAQRQRMHDACNGARNRATNAVNYFGPFFSKIELALKISTDWIVQ